MIMAQRKSIFLHSTDLEQLSYPAASPFKTNRAALTRKTVFTMGLLSGEGRAEVAPVKATRTDLEKFHKPHYLDAILAAENGELSATAFSMGLGTEDCPVFKGMYDYASLASGASLTGARLLLSGEADIAFNPSGGYHHAFPDRAAGFCYINDVVLAACAGGFRTYLLARGEQVEGTTIRSLVPVSMRTEDQRGQMGNHVTAVFAELPVGIADPLARLDAIHAQMDHLKHNGQAIGVEAMLSAGDFVPATLMSLGARVYAHTGQWVVNTVTTNVPGPQQPLYLLDRQMLQMYPYIPVALGVRISVGIMSYDGQLAVGVTGDYDAVPDLDVLCAAIEASFTELVASLPVD